MIRSRPQRVLDYPSVAVKRERIKARQDSYTATNDFEHCMLMADDRRRDGDILAAQVLENAAWAVRRHQKALWLSRKPAINRPVRRSV